jgi:hypothetical protein
MRKIIRVNGSEQILDGPKTINALRRMIKADALDIVLMADRKHVMLVDDLGHKKCLPTNDKATELYWQRCKPGTTHKIKGDVIIVPDLDFV